MKKDKKKSYLVNSFICYSEQRKQETTKCIDFWLERKNVSKTKFWQNYCELSTFMFSPNEQIFSKKKMGKLF